MSSYHALLAQRAELEAKIAAARDEEVTHALEQIRNIVDEYDLHDEVRFTRGDEEPNLVWARHASRSRPNIAIPKPEQRGVAAASRLRGSLEKTGNSF